jgi:hypothetical protein
MKEFQEEENLASNLRLAGQPDLPGSIASRDANASAISLPTTPLLAATLANPATPLRPFNEGSPNSLEIDTGNNDEVVGGQDRNCNSVQRHLYFGSPFSNFSSNPAAAQSTRPRRLYLENEK